MYRALVAAFALALVAAPAAAVPRDLDPPPYLCDSPTVEDRRTYVSLTCQDGPGTEFGFAVLTVRPDGSEFWKFSPFTTYFGTTTVWFRNGGNRVAKPTQVRYLSRVS